MQRKTFLILISCLWFFLSGCAGDLKSQVARLEAESRAHQATIKDKQTQITKLEADVSRLSSGNDALLTLLDKKMAEINKLHAGEDGMKATFRQKESQAGADRTAVEMGALKQQIGQLKAERDALQNERLIDEQLAKLRTTRLKVLTGNGNLGSAKEMAHRVEAMGYKVERVGQAPTANFSQHTVFYAPDTRNDADRIAKRLGGNAVVKPLTWPSIFNLIVVTGKTS